MARLTKSDLKEIVKECLVEILQEGINTDTSERQVFSESASKRESGIPSRRSAFDHVSWRKETMPEKQSVDYSETARQLSSDPVLASVLADSANTMREQMMAESRGPSVMSGDAAARQAAMSTPEDLFGSSAGKWATLAFE